MPPATPIDRISGLTTSIAVKAPCRAATTGAITLSGAQTIDSVACVAGDRVLVKDQANTVDNGIYVVATGTWTRAPDFDGARDAVQGTLVTVVSASGIDIVYRVTTTASPIVFGTSNITFAIALFGNSSALTFLQAGTGAVSRTAQNKMRDVICVLDFGATGDGATDDTTAFANALTAASGKALYVPDPATGYRITTTLTVPDNTTVYGNNKYATRIFLDAATTLMTLGAGAHLENLYLDGNAKAGIGVSMTGTNGQQQVHHCKITDFNATCINFAATTAGSGFSSVGLLTYRSGGASGTGEYAIVVQDAVQAAAIPRKFVNLETGGKCSISFGGSNSFYIANAFLDDMAWSANSSAVFITTSRIAGTTSPLVIKGGFTTIVGCDVYPIIQLFAGTSGNVIGPNAYNSNGTSAAPVDDNSGISENSVYHYDYAYTPTWQANAGAGGQPAIGSGAITARYNRQGNMVTVNIQLLSSATTTFGSTTSGIWQFTLPPDAPNGYGFDQIGGNIRGYDASAGIYYFGQVDVSAAYAEMERDTSNGFTYNNPVTWSSSNPYDFFNIMFQYKV